MWSWWNSLDTVSTLSWIARLLGIVIAVLVFILGDRVSALQRRAKMEEKALMAKYTTRLSPDDSKAISEDLSRALKCKIRFIWTAADADARIFGEQLSILFKEAGFTVEVAKGLGIGSEGSISIMPDPAALDEPMQRSLRRIASASNREVRFGGSGHGATKDDIVIIIGTR